LVFVQMWVRWTLPRLRIDQVMMTCLKYLLPISCVLLLGVSLWQVGVNPAVGPYFGYVLCAVCLALFAWMVVKLVTTQSKLPVAGAPNLWSRGPIPPELAHKR
jgi:NADH-quinone oxidoreductase subunit H